MVACGHEEGGDGSIVLSKAFEGAANGDGGIVWMWADDGDVSGV